MRQLFLPVLWATWLAAPVGLAAQAADSMMERLRADYAVPDAPALTLLELDESDLLRPTSVRDLTVALAEFTGPDGGFRLPRAFAVEFSPGLLFFGRQLTLKQYQAKPKLYRFRISLAVQRDEESGSPTRMALGARTSLSDDSDLRMNRKFLRAAEVQVQKAAVIDSIAEERAAESGGLDAEVVYTADELAQLESLEKSFRTLAEDAAEEAWNQQMLDVGAGLRLDAADSLGNDLSVQQLAGWFSYADNLGGWGQLLAGLKLGSTRDSTDNDFTLAASGALRFYAGSNKYKVYAGLQGAKMGDQDAIWLAAGGLELNATRGLWVVATVGTEWGAGIPDNRLRAHVGFRGGFPR